MSPKISTHWNIITKLYTKRENFKSSMRKNIHIRESPKGYHQIIQEKLCKAEESGMIYSKWRKKKKSQQKIHYVTTLSLGIKDEVKTFPSKQKLNEFITTRPALKEMLKDVLCVEIKWCYLVTWKYRAYW